MFPWGISQSPGKGSNGSQCSFSYGFSPENPWCWYACSFLHFCFYIIFSVHWWFSVNCLDFYLFSHYYDTKIRLIIQTTSAIIMIWLHNCSFPWIRKLPSSYEYLSSVCYLSSLTLGWMTMKNSWEFLRNSEFLCSLHLVHVWSTDSPALVCSSMESQLLYAFQKSTQNPSPLKWFHSHFYYRYFSFLYFIFVISVACWERGKIYTCAETTFWARYSADSFKKKLKLHMYHLMVTQV